MSMRFSLEVTRVEAKTIAKPRRRVAVAVKEREKNIDLIFLELVETLRDVSTANVKVGKLVHELREHNIKLDEIARRLTESGVTSVDITTLSKLATNYKYYCVDLGLCKTLNEFPYSTLYEIHVYFKRAKLSAQEVESILNAIRGMSRSEAVAYVRSLFGEDEHQGEVATLRINKYVAEQFDEWRARLLAAAQTAGENIEEITPTEALEKLLAIVEPIDHKALVKIWRGLHGEE